MKRVGIIGLVLEHLLIKPIGVAEAPLLLVCQRLLQDILDREFHGVVRSSKLLSGMTTQLRHHRE